MFIDVINNIGINLSGGRGGNIAATEGMLGLLS